jgi:predicted ArsR family transcriptional regulator
MSRMGEIAAGEIYPNDCGWKEPTTSRDAARSARRSSKGLQRAILGLLEADGPRTPDEAADDMQKSILAIRPRFSELLALGLIEPTGTRRSNSSGLMAKEYRIKP